VGEFVSRQERSVTQAVFALTGDHWSRRFVRKKPPVFPRRTAPLVLYGPTVLQGRTPKTAPVGSHLDLVPTLIELAAPAGFAYPAFGRDLLAPAEEALGLGNLAVVGADFVLPIEPLVPPETRDGMPYAGMQPADLARLRRWFNDVHALGWWYLKHGTALS
jgi:hypothetical protein